MGEEGMSETLDYRAPAQSEKSDVVDYIFENNRNLNCNLEKIGFFLRRFRVC